MINYIYLKNFKAFQEADIPSTHLNIFAGLNGMGKSTFLQALLLLRQSYLQDTLFDKGLLLNGNYLELGKGKDVYSMYGTDDNLIKFEVEWDDELKLAGEFQRHDEVDLLPMNRPLTLSNPERIFQQSLFTHQCQYLSAERMSPKDFFPASAYHIEQLRSLGNHGQFTVHFIAKNQRIARKCTYQQILRNVLLKYVIVEESIWGNTILVATKPVMQIRMVGTTLF